MNPFDRRNFLKQAGSGAAASAPAWSASSPQAAEVQNRLAIGILGCARGVHIGRCLAAQNVAVAYTCDPD